MQQHPVPQNIQSFEFRLIGDMTVKQFFYVAAGGGLAYIFFSSPLPYFFIRALLGVFFGFFGFALAFLPVNGQPLERWVLAFFRAVYQPTMMVWVKEKPAFRFFPEIIPTILPTLGHAAPGATNRKQIETYLSSLPARPLDPLDIREQKRLEDLPFDELSRTVGLPVILPIISPDSSRLFVRRDEVSPANSSSLGFASSLSDKKLISFHDIDRERPRIIARVGSVRVRKLKPLSPRLPIHGQFVNEKDLEDEASRELIDRETGLSRELAAVNAPVAPKFTIVQKTAPGRAPLPVLATKANIVSAIVKDPEGKTLENVVVLISDASNIPVRALRTNRLGQFVAVTPLQNGVYTIELEKEGFEFDIIKIELKGEVLSPFEITCKSTTTS